MITTHFAMFSFFNGMSGSNTPPVPPQPFGRSGLGGDDVPYRKNPNKGWDRAEWERRKRDMDAMEATIRETFLELRDGPFELVAEAVIESAALPANDTGQREYDWAAVARSFDNAAALTRMKAELDELRAAQEDEDTIVMEALLH